ncbi:MAG: FAD-dependent thymidylate synthase [Erysipelotrichaceae bacterium]|nr:FAD-dependent thymidylate synthase [Erysipelotrichaceae bacterium]
MKLIESKVEVIEQQPGLEGMYKQIELAGRTCYKSEDKITEDSAKEFVDRMIKSKHGAMLEHGTVYFNIPVNIDEAGNFLDEVSIWTKCKLVESEKGNWWAITTNLRVMVEHFAPEYIEDLIEKYLCEPTEHHEKRITARFTCDRGVSHEIVRHRVMSFAQESTRYCNYSKNKFGCELTFIKPSWYDKTLENKHGGFEKFLEDAQSLYITLLDQGYLPQEARACLPNALKTEIVVTGFESDWEHFFELRTAGAAHPDMRKLALELQEKLNSVNK